MMLNSYENVWHAIDELETNAILLVDSEGYIQEINKGVTSLLGFNEHDLIGKRVEIMMPDDVRKLHRTLFKKYVDSRRKEAGTKSKLIGVQRFFPDRVVAGGNKPIRFSAIHKNKTEVPVSLTINEIWSESNELAGFIAIISNNTEQYNLQQQLRDQATYDSLTGLINWQEFEKQIHTVKRGMQNRNMDYHASLLYMDIDYFKLVTYFSQKTGDSALKKITAWLVNNTRQTKDRPKDVITLSRFLGDKFILYLPNTSVDGARVLASRLKFSFAKLNLRTKEKPFFTTISIGIAEITSSTTLQHAVSDASQACSDAKARGKNKVVVAQLDVTKYIQLESIIRDAIQNRKLRLYAQKIVAISPEAKSIDNNLAHFEVLLRMEDKQGNIISPAEFIPAAEKTGLAIAIDKYVIEQTLSAFRDNAGYEKALSLCSINLSGISVADEQMFSFIEQQIRQYGINPCKLCFEITETHEILDKEAALKLVSTLRELGCKSAFDDFGIGYSNYQSFSRLPVDIIKIDGSYVRNVLKDKQLRTDMEGIINSAKSRGLEIVGEFAENKKIVEELKRLGVDYAQGYHFGKPVPLDTLIKETMGKP